MKPHRLYAYLIVALVALLGGSSLAAGNGSPRHDFTEPAVDPGAQSEYVMVKLKDHPVASYEGGIPGLQRTKPERGEKLDKNDPAVKAYLVHLEKGHKEFRSYLNRHAPKAEVARELFFAFNGFAVKLNGARAESLARGPGVAAVGYSDLYQMTMNQSVALISATELWPALGGRTNAGDGIKVGIIDSGIDDNHPFFACKDVIPHKVYASGVAFDPSNVLVNDHGTHVAGTVAGCVVDLATADASGGPIIGMISGVAPGAALYDYNVFPGFGAGWVAFGGSAFSHDIAAALEDAVLDGVDIVNMSLGGSVQGQHDFLAEAVNATVDAGIVAAVAAGNSGPGDSTVSSPGNAANALTAGATTNSHVLGVPVTVQGTTYVGAAGDFDPYVETQADGVEMADWAATGGDITACSAAPDASPVAGKIVLISRGACTFTTKVRNAQNAGAFGVVVYNNVSGPPVSMAHDGTDPFPTIPAVMVSKDDGAVILASLPATADITGPPVELPAEPDIIAGFSSRGPTPFTYLIKPDLTAPGVNVYSSVFEGEFAMFQGTSMATPHLAGGAALLLDLHDDWSPDDVKSAMVNTADRVVTDGTVDPGVLARGGGRLNLQDAANTPLTIAPASASFGYWNGNKPVSAALDLTLNDVEGDGADCTIAVEGDPIVSASTSAFMVGAGGSATVTLSLDAGRTADTPSGDYDGDIVLTCDGTELLVPYWTRIDREAKP